MSDMSRQFPRRSSADQMGARGQDPEPYRPTANSSSRSRRRAQDAATSTSSRCKAPEPQEAKVVVDLEMQTMSVEKQPDLQSSSMTP